MEQPAAYPGDRLCYLANVYNHQAQRSYLKHGVQVVEAAYESHQQTGEVSLMITRHCARHSLSLCPKQTKGITGVPGTLRAEPLQLVNGSERLTLVFDCQVCEMHVVGRIKRAVLNQVAEQPLRFDRAGPLAAPGG